MNVSATQVCEDMMMLLRHWKTVLTGLSEERGLTQMQIVVLYSIDQEGQLAMGKIAGILHCDASNVTGIVDRLVAHDLVVRTEHAQDRRTKILKLTGKGANLVAELKQALPEKLGCSKLSAKDRNELHDIIFKVCG